MVPQWQLTWEVDMDIWKNFPRPPCGMARVKKNLYPSLENSGGSFCREIHEHSSSTLTHTSHTRDAWLTCLWSQLSLSSSCFWNTPTDYCFFSVCLLLFDKVLYIQPKHWLIFSFIELTCILIHLDAIIGAVTLAAFSGKLKVMK